MRSGRGTTTRKMSTAFMKPAMTAASPLVRQGGVIGGRVEAEHRELEAVLPFRLAVTARRVAAEAAQKRQDVVLEVEAARLLRPLHLDGHAEGAPAGLDGDRRRSV